MKKIYLLIGFCICFCLSIETEPVNADEITYQENGYAYNLVETAGGEKYAAIVEYLGNETNLIVPDSLGGCPVREVKLNSMDNADFMRYEQIESVVFPDTMVNLNANACMYFSNLTSVTIQEGAEFIGTGAFLGCLNLQSIVIPASVTNMYGEISNNETLKYQVQNGSYADEYLTEAGKNVVRTGSKISVTDLRIEGKRECSKTLEFTAPLESRILCLEAEISPANASNRRIKWEAEGEDVVLYKEEEGLNNNGSKIYFSIRKGGAAKLTAVSEDGGYTAVCRIDAAVDISCQEIILSNNTFEYDGREKRPQVTVKGLTEGIDYTVSYGNNIAAGTGTVTISGLGGNTGQVTKNFTITPGENETVSGSKGDVSTAVSVKMPAGIKVKNIKKKKVKITWKTEKDADGYEIYRSTKKNGKYKKIKTVNSNFVVKFTDSKVKTRKQYFYKLRSYKAVNGTRCYSSFTKAKKVTVKK